MKNILLLILALTVLPMEDAFSQNRALNKFYRQHKREHGVQNMRLPGWLVKLGSGIAKKHVKEREEKLALDLAKEVGTSRIMFSEDGVSIPREDLSKLRQDLLDDHFDDLLQVREGKMTLDLMIRESGGVIRNLFFVYHDGESGEMVFFSARTSISMEQIAELVKTAMENEVKEAAEEIFVEPEPEPILEPQT